MTLRLVLLLVIRAPRRRKMYRPLAANLLEHQQVARLDNSYENYREVSAPTLLMFGGRSDLGWVAFAVERLAKVLPASRPRGFETLNHSGPDRSGPCEVAHAVRQYFLE